jgi:glutamyl/glutaminyl-tRNA synthetase
LFEYYIDSSDFDKKHEKYGTFVLNLPEVAKNLGYSSENSVRVKHKKLLLLGLISETNSKNVYKIKNFDRYVLNKGAFEYVKEEKDQKNELILQKIGVEFQQTEGKVQKFENIDQNNLKQVAPKYLSSFKVQSNVIADTNQSYLSIKEDEVISYTREQWELIRIEDSALPSWENKLLIDESLRDYSTSYYEGYSDT